jgi:MoaA/NifB/PqqE/SkfB family radical SAM enzyme
MKQLIHQYGNLFLVEREIGYDCAFLTKEQYDILRRYSKLGTVEKVVEDLTGGREYIQIKEIKEHIGKFLDNCQRRGIVLDGEPFITGETGKYYPRTLNIELTDCCNLYCRHCYKSASSKKDVFLDGTIVGDILYKYVNKIPIIHFTGGEPLLWPGMEGILSQWGGKYIINITTNGTLICKYDDSVLKSVNNFQVSLYGHDYDSYKAFTGNGALFDDVLKGLKKLNRIGKSFSIGIIMTEDFIENVTVYMEMLKDYPINRITFSEISKTGRGREYNSMYESKLNPNVVAIINRYFQGKTNIDAFISNKEYLCDEKTCTAGEIQIALSERGKLIYCHTLDHESFEMGNYDDFETIISKGRDEEDFWNRIHNYCLEKDCGDDICPLISKHYEKIHK